MTQTPEAELKKRIKDYLDDEGVYWSMIAGGAFAKKGDPDIIACVDGAYLAIEAKVDTRQSEWQKLRQRQIENAGGIYIIAKSVEDVSDAVGRIRGAKDGDSSAEE